MEDEDSQGDDEITFSLELSPTMMYSLNTILHYNTVQMEDPGYSHTSEALARKVQNVISSDEFDEAMEDEIESFKENNNLLETSPELQKTVGGGVQ